MSSFQTNTVSKLLHFLNGTYIPDETFWTTLTGNFHRYSVPGGTNAEEWLEFRDLYKANHSKEVEQYIDALYTNVPMNYYLARHQIWYKNCGGPRLFIDGDGQLLGQLVSGSCVFGVDDLANLLRRPHLIAHKMYLDFQPAAFFCVLKEIRARENLPLRLNLTAYAEIPQVELSAGVPYEQLKHPTWMFFYP
ncbi:hypothetical protein OESDEN_02467 [Oesophagostomum dentatum]|uniref:Uncharacterized protein n=1 Tax=Oesophagostomum dentatum TaxID=61180 RepID=A0A0B1TJY1_OESDE|nr:hypothetical protein OESDEN_02467 [Oesophagostomum dentatum]